MIEIRHQTDLRTKYDSIYQGQYINQMESFFIWIQEILKVTRGSLFLDISTGRGRMVKVAARRGVRAYGIDFSMNACRIASQVSPGRIICSDAQYLPFADASFDFVTNLGSLEHLDDMSKGVREIVRVLKDDGWVCITVPNTFGLFWNVQVAWRTGDVDDDGQPIQRYGTRKQWEKLLQENGLEIVRVYGYEHEHAPPRTWFDLKRYCFRPFRIMRMLLSGVLPVNMAGQFVFICKKKIPWDRGN
jgi:ubiquinone/menaquinone biosynthesis C-methylase UbiE